MSFLILGGGVAGLSAALSLRAIGREPVLVDPREAGHPPARSVHVHRIGPGSLARLATVCPDLHGRLAQTGAGMGRIGRVAGDRLVWGDEAMIVTLAMLEAALGDAVEALGVPILRGRPVPGVEPVSDGWSIRIPGQRRVVEGVIDASGGQRAGVDLFGDHLPDLDLDDVGEPQAYASWAGQTVGGRPWLVACRDPQRGLDGLVQVLPGGMTTLTLRHRAGCAPPDRDAVLAGLGDAGGSGLRALLADIAFEPRPVRHLAPGARRVALERARSEAMPPLALIGDALMQMPPRFGGGVARAIHDAVSLADGIAGGQPVATIGRDLAVQAPPSGAARAWR